jgi:transposase
MALSLSESEIQKRLTRLRNLERLHEIQKQEDEKLRAENKALKAQLKEKDAQIEQLLLRVEQLEEMVFGRKKDDDSGDSAVITTRQHERKSEKNKRTADSYRRAIPKRSDITKRTPYPLKHCPECDTKLTRKKIVIRYIEDIVLPTEKQPLKTVEKQTIESGYCSQCDYRMSVVPIPRHTVTLGSNIQQFIVYAVTVLRLSFSLVSTFLETTYGISVSDGEIASIQEKHSLQLLPEYEAMKNRIRGKPAAHYDETGWPVQKETTGKFAWVMVDTEGDEMVFTLGQTRGKGNAEKLRGDSDHIGISDDYPGYKNTFKIRQLCWAHPNRKLRDLARSKILSCAKRNRCAITYAAFMVLYAKVDRASKREPFHLPSRKRLMTMHMKEFMTITRIHCSDPQKLKIIKTSLRENSEHYFTCLLYEGVPPDNNMAERSLRHLVIKRKTSLGSKTDRGAKAMEILMSVMLSLYRKNPDSNFFPEYAKLLKQVPKAS